MRIKNPTMAIALAITVFAGVRFFSPTPVPKMILLADVTDSMSFQRFQSGIAYPCATLVCLDLPRPDKSPDETISPPGAPIKTGITLVDRASIDLTIPCKQAFLP